jgi:uncharacterized protein (TIGR00299 family) protein
MSTSRLAAYFDCFSGASGDMLIGALLDAGLPLDALRAELNKLALSGYALSAERRQQHGLMGTKFHVQVDLSEQPHRHLSDIEAILAGSHLPDADIARSLAVFGRLARAEAKVHGTSIEHVHFHEVGAVDSIVDVVGFVVGLRLLKVEAVFCSPLALGSGFVETEHGRLPVPAPATAEILAEAGAPTRPSDAGVELLTPTGAALLCELATFCQPAMRPSAIGYGFGSRQLPWINAVRVWLGEPSEMVNGNGPDTPEAVIGLECNIDDMTPEQLGYVLGRLLEAGALDAWFTPIQMKKNRPAVMLSALARPADSGRLSQLLLSETSTLGVRYQRYQRDIAERETVTVSTPWGPARAKLKRLAGGVVSAAPEYEDCALLARQAGIPIGRVYEAVLAGYRTSET